MNTREMNIAKIALSYLLSNLDDVCELFETDDTAKINYNGEIIDKPTEDEIEELMKQFQG